MTALEVVCDECDKCHALDWNTIGDNLHLCDDCYDKKADKFTWTVWVGGIQVTDYHVTLEEAREIAERYIGEGYTDTHIDNITWADIDDGECLVCPACSGYQTTDNIETAYDMGYPDGFTCADCGVVK